MYSKRVKIFVILSLLLLLLCLLRLLQIQLLADSAIQDHIAELMRRRGLARQLKTVRGNILDRKGRILATDEPRVELHITYNLTQYMDDRIKNAELAQASQNDYQNQIFFLIDKKFEAKLDQLRQVINKCSYFGLDPNEAQNRINQINDRLWNLRTFLAWVRSGPDPNVLEKYNNQINSVPFSEALTSFEKKFPDQNTRLIRIYKVNDVREINSSYSLLELRTEDDIFTAQLEFMDINDVFVVPKAHRIYPYDSVAAQTIGWVGPATQSKDKQLFEEDRLASYLDDEVCGREDGVEYVCEAILRGKRGEIVYNIDRELITETETLFGTDVQLTLDIELQSVIENYLATYPHQPGCGPGMAPVVIDVNSSDTLVMVSIPTFSLDTVRQNYDSLINDPNKPLINRTINQWYPPGSVVKPITLIAGLETGKIDPQEVINCPAEPAPAGWPNCLVFNQNRIGHDYQWHNNARNAIKGSCNIYFSHLGDRIETRLFQKWLFNFGYGHQLLSCPFSIKNTEFARNFRQLPGMISDTLPEGPVSEFQQIPNLHPSEKRWFGMGQGKLLATPLQVANGIAVIARRGIFRYPHLFIDNNRKSKSYDLNISDPTMDTVLDGMSAVVNEYGGNAYRVFYPSLNSFTYQDVKIFGKTGSTQPDNAWFAGFALDSKNNAIAFAVVVEGGQRGSRDAAPLARDIIQFCIDFGYVGKTLAQN